MYDEIFLKKYIEKENKNIIIKYINYQQNSINGILFKGKVKYFFKIISTLEYEKEQKAILLCGSKYPIKKHAFCYDLFNNSKKLVLYEYDNKVGHNKGLLNDFFIIYDFYEHFNSKSLKKILSFYKENSREKVLVKESPIDVFFYNRVDSRLNKWYKFTKQFEKKVIFNGINSISTNDIIKETADYFKKRNSHYAFLTQGDHNSLNISVTPTFFDISTLGYNQAIGEFAMCFISILIFDQYFCPKYHPQSYKNHDKIYKILTFYKPDISYIMGDEIVIYSDFKVTLVRKNYVLEFLDIVKNFDIYEGLIYFLIMRLLCIFNINQFDDDDFYYIVYLIHYFYNNLKNNDYNILYKFINSINILSKE